MVLQQTDTTFVIRWGRMPISIFIKSWNYTFGFRGMGDAQKCIASQNPGATSLKLENADFQLQRAFSDFGPFDILSQSSPTSPCTHINIQIPQM
jgi:hypothetical protein